MYKVERWDKEENCWMPYSQPKNLEYAGVHFEVLRNMGKKVRVLHQGKIVKEG